MNTLAHEDMVDLDQTLVELGIEARKKAERGVITEGDAVLVNLLCGIGAMILRMGEKIDLTNDLLSDLVEKE